MIYTFTIDYMTTRRGDPAMLNQEENLRIIVHDSIGKWEKIIQYYKEINLPFLRDSGVLSGLAYLKNKFIYRMAENLMDVLSHRNFGIRSHLLIYCIFLDLFFVCFGIYIFCNFSSFNFAHNFLELN